MLPVATCLNRKHCHKHSQMTLHGLLRDLISRSFTSTINLDSFASESFQHLYYNVAKTRLHSTDAFSSLTNLSSITGSAGYCCSRVRSACTGAAVLRNARASCARRRLQPRSRQERCVQGRGGHIPAGKHLRAALSHIPKVDSVKP